MTTVAVSREVDAPAGDVRAAIADREAFMRAGGFDGVAVEGERIHVENRVGIASIELDLWVVESDAALAYEQREGLFERMYTEYVVEEREGGTTVRAYTEFTLGGVLGEFLDATVIKRQRRKELTAQLEYLASVVG